MATVTVCLAEEIWADPRLRTFANAMGWGRAAAVGQLAEFWYETRRRKLVAASQRELEEAVLLDASQKPRVLQALLSAGFIAPDDDGLLVVMGNYEHFRVNDARARARLKCKKDHPPLAQMLGISQATLRRIKDGPPKIAPLVLAPTDPKKRGRPAKAIASPRAETRYQALNREVWEAYRSAYAARWGIEPIRNAKVNSCIASLVQRLGPDAVPVIQFYLGHEDPMYLRNMHGVGLALQNAEALHAQWKTGRTMTADRARAMQNGMGAMRQIRLIQSGAL